MKELLLVIGTIVVLTAAGIALGESMKRYERKNPVPIKDCCECLKEEGK